jgi:RecJ-like exonuclease
MFWDTLRGMLGAGWGFDSGGECPACKHKGCIWVTLSPRGLAWMGCRNCTWKAEECPTCDGTGVLGYDSTCDDCRETGHRLWAGRPTESEE